VLGVPVITPRTVKICRLKIYWKKHAAEMARSKLPDAEAHEVKHCSHCFAYHLERVETEQHGH
jgi:hypothetical protein